MKNSVLRIACALLLVVAVFFGYLAFIGNHADASANYYALTAVVVEVNRVDDIVVVVDGAGNAWEFTECDDWQVGDFASLLMNNNNTTNIYDDEIVSVKYGGCF